MNERILRSIVLLALLPFFALAQNFSFQGGGGGGGTIINNNPGDWSVYPASNDVTYLYGRDIRAGTLLSWVSRTNAADAYYAFSIAQTNKNRMTGVVLGSPTFQTSVDGGLAWTVRTNTVVPYDVEYDDSVMSDDGNVRLAVGYNVLARSPSAGVTWIFDDTIFTDVSDIDCNSNGSQVIASGSGYKIQVSDDFGVTWLTVGVARVWADVATMNSGAKMAAAVGGAAGSVYVSTDYGTNWTAVLTETNLAALAYSRLNGGYLMAVTTDGDVLSSLDNGTTWTHGTISGFTPADICMSQDGRVVHIAGSSDIYSSWDYGATFCSNGVAGAWNQMECSSDGLRIVVVDGGMNWRILDFTEEAKPIIEGFGTINGVIMEDVVVTNDHDRNITWNNVDLYLTNNSGIRFNLGSHQPIQWGTAVGANGKIFYQEGDDRMIIMPEIITSNLYLLGNVYSGTSTTPTTIEVDPASLHTNGGGVVNGNVEIANSFGLEVTGPAHVEGQLSIGGAFSNANLVMGTGYLGDKGDIGFLPALDINTGSWWDVRSGFILTQFPYGFLFGSRNPADGAILTYNNVHAATYYGNGSGLTNVPTTYDFMGNGISNVGWIYGTGVVVICSNVFPAAALTLGNGNVGLLMIYPGNQGGDGNMQLTMKAGTTASGGQNLMRVATRLGDSVAGTNIASVIGCGNDQAVEFQSGVNTTNIASIGAAAGSLGVIQRVDFGSSSGNGAQSVSNVNGNADIQLVSFGNVIDCGAYQDGEANVQLASIIRAGTRVSQVTCNGSLQLMGDEAGAVTTLMQNADGSLSCGGGTTVTNDDCAVFGDGNYSIGDGTLSVLNSIKANGNAGFACVVTNHFININDATLLITSISTSRYFYSASGMLTNRLSP